MPNTSGNYNPISSPQSLRILFLLVFFVVGLLAGYIVSVVLNKMLFGKKVHQGNRRKIRKRMSVLGGLLLCYGAVYVMQNFEIFSALHHDANSVQKSLFDWFLIPFHMLTLLLILLLSNTLINAFFVLLHQHNQDEYGYRKTILGIFQGVTKIGVLVY